MPPHSSLIHNSTESTEYGQGIQQEMKATGGASDMRPLPEDFEPGEKDVICSWARQNHKHGGNTRFRDLVDEYAPAYVRADTKYEKTKVIATLIDKIRNESPNGGFVKRDFYTGRWFEIGLERARDKVGHAVRKAADKLVREREGKGKKKTSKSKEAIDQLKGTPSSTHAYLLPTPPITNESSTYSVPTSAPLPTSHYYSRGTVMPAVESQYAWAGGQIYSVPSHAVRRAPAEAVFISNASFPTIGALSSGLPEPPAHYAEVAGAQYSNQYAVPSNGATFSSNHHELRTTSHVHGMRSSSGLLHSPQQLMGGRGTLDVSGHTLSSRATTGFLPTRMAHAFVEQQPLSTYESANAIGVVTRASSGYMQPQGDAHRPSHHPEDETPIECAKERHQTDEAEESKT